MKLSTAGIVLIVIHFFSTFSYGQTSRGVKISELRVEGTKSTDENLVRLTTGIEVGSEVSQEDIQNAIKKLWNIGIFEDIEIVASNNDKGELILTFRLKEYRRMARLEIEGNKKIKRKKIDETLDMIRGQIVSPTQVQRGIKKLNKLYAEEGYHLAKIEFNIRDSDEENKVIIKYKINEGEKIQIKEIFFTGNEKFEDGKLKKELKEIKEDRWWRSGDFTREKYDNAKEKLIAFYRKNGYRDIEILSDSISYDTNKKDMYIYFNIFEGLQYYIGNVKWDGNQLFTSENLNKILGFQKGDILDEEKFRTALAEKVQGAYYDEGYIYTNVIPREVPVSADTVDIIFTVIEGNPVKIRRIDIVGNDRTKEKVIRRELQIHPGDRFSKAALMRSQREIFILNYFSNVIPDVRPVDDDQIDLVFEVEEQQTGTVNMSAGFSERDGAIGSLGVGFNNFLGNGQSLNVNWQFGGRGYRVFQVGFVEPWLFDRPILAGASIFDSKSGGRRKELIGYETAERGFSLQLGKRLRWPDDYFRGNWTWRFADRTTTFRDDLDITQQGRLFVESGDETIITLTQVISRDSRDAPQFPTRGTTYSLSTEIGGGILGGTEKYFKHVFRSEWYMPVFWKFVLFTSTQFGIIHGFSSIQSDVPLQERFHLGGSGLTVSTALRGYDDYALSPTSTTADGARFRVGGASLIKYSTEFRIPLVPNPTVYGLLFAEAGNSWLLPEQTNPSDLRRSAGFGIRIFMPMLGMIGLDYGYGFDDIDLDGFPQGWKPHFRFGQSF